MDFFSISSAKEKQEGCKCFPPMWLCEPTKYQTVGGRLCVFSLAMLAEGFEACVTLREDSTGGGTNTRLEIQYSETTEEAGGGDSSLILCEAAA